MADVDLDSGTGYFNRSGHLIETCREIVTNYMGNIETTLEGLRAKTATTDSENEMLLVGRMNDIAAMAEPALLAHMETAERMTIKLVDDSVTLPSKTVTEAIIELRDQMEGNAEGLAHTKAGVVNAADAGNTGNGEILVDLTDNKGEPLPYIRAEIITVKCNRDAQEGGSVDPGTEQFRITGERRLPRENAKWPGGSGAAMDTRVARAEDDSGTGWGVARAGQNILNNSDFENISTGLPNKWDEVLGTAQTTYDETTSAFIGSKAYRIIGTGTAEKTEIRQRLNNTAGTLRNLRPFTTYGMGFWYRLDGDGALAGGVLRVQLQSAAGVVISVTPLHDATAINARITVDLTSSPSTTYAFAGATFTTPAVVPSDTEIAIEMTTAITSGRWVAIDEVIVQPLIQAYPNGPYVGLFRGDTDFVLDDFFTMTMSNNDSKANLGYSSDWLLNLQELGVALPTLAASTIADGLITN